MYWAIAEMLIASLQLGSARELPSAERLRVELHALLRRMVDRGRAAGIPDLELAEARYALVAFADDRILKSNWVGRAEWMKNPLQLELFREYTAGENFFVRMRALLARPQPSPALHAYYFCLVLGFTGALPGAAGAQNATSFLEAAHARIGREARELPLAPHAVPRDRRRPRAPRGPLVLLLALGSALVVAVALGLLTWSMTLTLDRTERDLASTKATPELTRDTR